LFVVQYLLMKQANSCGLNTSSVLFWVVALQDLWLLQLGPDVGNGLQHGQMIWQQLQVPSPAAPQPRQSCSFDVGDNCFFVVGGYASAEGANMRAKNSGG
jgi:hypothetical protein